MERLTERWNNKYIRIKGCRTLYPAEERKGSASRRPRAKENRPGEGGGLRLIETFSFALCWPALFQSASRPVS